MAHVNRQGIAKKVNINQVGDIIYINILFRFNSFHYEVKLNREYHRETGLNFSKYFPFNTILTPFDYSPCLYSKKKFN